MQVPPTKGVLRFGVFEVDLETRELRKNGQRLKLQSQPLEVLVVLLEQAGEIVSRDDLAQRVWDEDTHVDVYASLATAINKIRDVLNDSADHPRFVETITKRGYRFLAHVDRTRLPSFPTHQFTQVAPLGPLPDPPPEPPVAAQPPALQPPAAAARDVAPLRLAPRRYVRNLGLLSTVLALAGIAWVYHLSPVAALKEHDSILLADLENGTGDKRFDGALQTALAITLEQSQYASVFPRARLESVLRRMGQPPDTPINLTVGREICQREGVRGLILTRITRIGHTFALQAELVEPQTGKVIRASSEQAKGEDEVMSALDRLAKQLRRDLGESLHQISAADRPLPEITTRSLTALKAFADAQLLWNNQKYKDAIALYDAAVAADPDFALAHAALGSAYYSYLLNEPDRGKQEYEHALALSSRITDRERMQIQLEYLDSQDHFDEAESLFRSYLREYPDDWSMRLRYSQHLRSHHKQTEALEQYRTLLQSAPSDAGLSIDMATTYAGLHRYDDAIHAYREAFRLRPDLNQGEINREYGFTLVANGQEPEAQQLFLSQLQNRDLRESALRSLAILDFLHGRMQSARQRFEDALLSDQAKRYPLSIARVHLWLAAVAEAQGDLRLQRAEQSAALDQFDHLGPKVTLGAWLGAACLRSGDHSQAGQMLHQITLAADQKNEQQMGYVHFLEGRIATSNRRFPDAIALLSLALRELESSNIEDFATAALARAYYDSGDLSNAISSYERLIGPRGKIVFWEPLPLWLEGHYHLAQAYLANNDPAHASAVLDDLLRLWDHADPGLPLLRQSEVLRHRIPDPQLARLQPLPKP